MSIDPVIVTREPRSATAIFSAPPQEVAPGVFMHAQFSNTYAIKTPVGLLLIDPGLSRLSGAVHRAVRAWSDTPVHTAVYTHGHIDPRSWRLSRCRRSPAHHRSGELPRTLRALSSHARPQRYRQQPAIRARGLLPGSVRLADADVSGQPDAAHGRP